MDFVSTQLYRLQDFEQLELFDEALESAQPVHKSFRLALVFASEVWTDGLLDPLDDLDEHLDDFSTYAFQIDRMRELVTAAYDSATNRCYGK